MNRYFARQFKAQVQFQSLRHRQLVSCFLANDIIQIKGTSIQEASVSIYDIRGRKHTNFKRLGANKIDVSKLASGLYFLKLNSFVYKVFKN